MAVRRLLKGLYDRELLDDDNPLPDLGEYTKGDGAVKKGSDLSCGGDGYVPKGVSADKSIPLD